MDSIKFRGRRLLKMVADAAAQNPIRRKSGATTTTVLDAFVFSYLIAIMACYLARKWQTALNTQGVSALSQHLTLALISVLVVACWSYVLRRWFLCMGWPRWYAIAYVVGILCPGTWLFAHAIEAGGDSIALLLLQTPVVLVYIRRYHRKTSLPK